jgi:hypothetical protein
LATNVIIAALAALSQSFASWLGWRVTVSTKPLVRSRRILYEILFVSCAVIGIGCVSFQAYRSGLERAHLAETSIDPSYLPIPFVVNEPLGVNVTVSNVGKGPAKIISHYARAYIQNDLSKQSQDETVSAFAGWMKTNPPKGKGELLPPTQPFFFTADGSTLTPEDYANLANGRRVLHVIAYVKYTDDFGTHEFQFCQMLQPIRPYSAKPIWAICEVYNDDK